MQLHQTDPEFQNTIARLAAVAQLTPNEVYALWQDYDRECQSADQSAVLFEFVRWYRPNLGGVIEPLDAALEATGAPKLPATRAQAVAALKTLEPFMGYRQRMAVTHGFRSEEKQFFYDKMMELSERVAGMAQTYDQDGKGDEAIVSLHYFAGGRANWYITEKDKGDPNDKVPGQQQQAFGLADLFGDGGELGYISIAEIIANHGELDFHFKPCPLGEVRAKNSIHAV